MEISTVQRLECHHSTLDIAMVRSLDITTGSSATELIIVASKLSSWTYIYIPFDDFLLDIQNTNL